METPKSARPSIRDRRRRQFAAATELRNGGEKRYSDVGKFLLIVCLLGVFKFANRSAPLTTNRTATASPSNFGAVPNNMRHSENKDSPPDNDSKLPGDTMPTWPGIPSRNWTSKEHGGGGMKLLRLGPDAGPVEDSKRYLVEHFEEFLEVYKNRPDKTNTCGIRIPHALAVYFIAKRLQPTTIIESGINSGQSTYFFRKACPDAKIISIDPEIKPICGQPVRWIDDTNNEYLTGDTFVNFDAVNWGECIQSGSLDPASPHCSTLLWMIAIMRLEISNKSKMLLSP